jgi:hypothetical protein
VTLQVTGALPPPIVASRTAIDALRLGSYPARSTKSFCASAIATHAPNNPRETAIARAIVENLVPVNQRGRLLAGGGGEHP